VETVLVYTEWENGWVSQQACTLRRRGVCLGPAGNGGIRFYTYDSIFALDTAYSEMLELPLK
jgi:hypothetical protein